MKLIQVAAAVLNQTPLDWDGNQSRLRSAIEAARQREVSLLCMPELSTTGYGCEDAFFSTGVREMAARVLHDLLPDTRGMIVSFGLPVMYRGALYDAACLAVDGRILGLVPKQNLAGEGIHYEPRWFKPWPSGVTGEVELGDTEYPIGDLVFDCGGLRIGYEICEDAWVADRPGGGLARRGVDVILNPSGSHFAFGKHEVRRRFVLEGSRSCNVSYLYSNLVGNEAGRAIYDGGAMIASAGKMLVEGPRFSFEDVQVVAAAIDVDATRMSRSRTATYEPLVDHDDATIEVDFEFPTRGPTEVETCRQAWSDATSNKEEEFTRAVALALFDYLRKSRSRGFVVSISGGADSAAVAVLCSLAIRFGVDELGLNGMKRKLAYVDGIDTASSADEIVGRLVSCVYQSTRNSSDTTRNAARAVAAQINAEFLQFDVDSLVQDYVGIVSTAIDRELTWESDDLALQNIQARVRAPGVWLLANLRGALLLSTSNRSEAAVGYATMDGDTAGGLSPVAGIDKAFLRHWLRWIETDGPEGIGPLSALSHVNQQQPTAELRPHAAGQTDEADLMPYEVLDEIERAAIRDKQSPREVFQVIASRHTSYTTEQLLLWVERFFRLWSRNQWKRERYAPSFHLDDENLDPKTWCRFPILSGGFERELRELREYVDLPNTGAGHSRRT